LQEVRTSSGETTDFIGNGLSEVLGSGANGAEISKIKEEFLNEQSPSL
jgi:hypothetical protein